MPIDHAIDGDVIVTTLRGVVTDDELLAYYRQPAMQTFTRRWLELVDGTGIVRMNITPEGQTRLAEFLSMQIERLRGGRVAMVANSDVTYGMFRMWEIQREDLEYTVRVFRDPAAARQWIADEVS